MTSATQDYPTVNTSVEIWKDVDTEYFLAHQQENEYTTQLNNKLYWYERAADPVNQGEIVLDQASNFPVDATSIFSATLLSDMVWVAYRTSSGAGVASCKLTVTTGTVGIADPADCTDYPIPAGFSSPTTIRVYSEDTNFYAYILTRTANTFALGSCTLDAATKTMKDCLSSNKSIDISGEKFLKIEFDNISGASILFSDSDASAEIKVSSTIVFGVEFQVDKGVVNFDYLQDKNSKTLIATPNKVFSLRATTFSTFTSVSELLYVSIFTKNFTGGSTAVVKLSQDTESSKILFSTLTLTIQENSTTGYSRTAQLPSVVNYKQDQLVRVPTSRAFFKGNNLDFSIDSPDFKIYNVYTWRDTATEGIAGDLTIAGSVGGVATDIVGSTIQAFYCSVVGLNASFSCQTDGDATTVTGLASTIFAVEATPYDLTDSSIIAVTTTATDTQLTLFNKGKLTKQAAISGFVATKDTAHYQRIETLYTLWTISGGVITVTTWDNSDLTGAKTVTVNSATFGIPAAANFCPIAVQSNPADPGQTFVVSSCDNT